MARDVPWIPEIRPPATVQEHRERFCRDLEDGRWRRGARGVYRWRGGYCAMGAALEYCGRVPILWAGPLIAPIATRGKLDIGIGLALEIEWLNAAGSTLPEIAARLRQHWRAEA